MGRHGGDAPAASAPARRRLPVVTAIVVGVMVLVAVGLAIWWWQLRSPTDPVSAHPISADAVVLSSPACGSGSTTTITLAGLGSSHIDSCGLTVGQHVTVEYLSGHPDVARLAGTTTAGPTSATSRWLPIGILVAGCLAIGATVVLLTDRRTSRSRPVGAPSGPAAPGLSVWDLRQSILGQEHPVLTAPTGGGSGAHAAPDPDGDLRDASLT